MKKGKKQIYLNLSHVLSPRRMILLGTLLTSLVVLAIVNDTILRKSQRWIEHTLEVRETLNELVSVLQEAVMAQRGFFLTDDEAYLEPYSDAQSAWRQTSGDLQRLVSDNPEQKLLTEELVSLVEEKFRQMQQMIHLHRLGEKQDAVDMVQLDTGKEILGQIRSKTETMMDAETQHLSERIQHEKTIRRLGLFIYILFVSAVFALMILGILQIKKTFEFQSAIQQQLKTLNRDLQKRVEERRQAEEAVRQKAKALEQSNKELEQFAYVASHDLQEPLRQVGSYVQMLAKRYEGQVDEKGQRWVNYTTEGVRRMQGLINDLLVYSRVRTKGAEPAPVDANAALDVALENLTEGISESGAEIDRGALPHILADKTQLAQLFQNLISNAVKFRKPDVPLRIRVTTQKPDEPGWIEIAVSDNGIGVAQEHAGRVFTIFQRLHTREEYPGTGIGLAICKSIVERHGGNIWIDSTPGEGCSVHFTMKGTKS